MFKYFSLFLASPVSYPNTRYKYYFSDIAAIYIYYSIIITIKKEEKYKIQRILYK